MSFRLSGGPGHLAALAGPAAASHSASGASLLGTPHGAKTPTCKFPVYELSEDRDAPPKTFHEAAERGNTAWCIRAIERTLDFDVNCRDRLMRTALHWAAEMGHHETAKTLIDFGVDVRTTDCTGRTAVHLAAKCGDAEMLRVLLAALCEADVSALVDLGDHNDITPVFLAVQRGEEGQDAFEFLMQHGARYNEPTVVEAAAAAAGGDGPQQ